MSAIKFNHVFAALLILSALCAFAIPSRYTVKAQPQVQSLFYPVARPVRSVAGWVHDRLARPLAKDTRTNQVLADENDALRQQLAMMSRALGEMLRRNAARELMGSIGEACTLFPVVGTDIGGREGLSVAGSTAEGLREKQYVLYPGGVVGVIERPPGLAGAMVRLVTDRGFRVGGTFVRWTTDESGKLNPVPLNTPPLLIEGIGDGAMHCATSLTMNDIQQSGLQVDDWVVVDDSDWELRMQGCRLGKVVRIAPQLSSPLYADIRIRPTTNLMGLREVMVLTK